MQKSAIKICPNCQARDGVDHHFCPRCGVDISGILAVEGDAYLDLVIEDKYRLVELLGAGAMGRVYRAEQLRLRKSFAVKILAPHLLHDEVSQSRFFAEAHNAASLNHPNCVTVLDHGRTQDGIAYIVMEFVPGQTLEQICLQGPLARERVIDLTLQILAALGEAHGLGILHRDLKPENILVQTLSTHGELAKVVDFGIAKLMDANGQGRPGLTDVGAVCGTPEYMSPEQARGDALDARSDLYSVGCILYQLMTGHPPFESGSAVELLHRHLHSEPVPPSRVLGTRPDALEAVCLRALAKQADQRFATALAFREALVQASRTGEEPTLATRCSGCGGHLAASARFCSSCGTPAPRRTAAAMRRRHPTRGSGLPRVSGEGGRTAEVVVRNFPLPLVGRDELLADFGKWLLEHQPGLRSRVLAGPPGIGKTRVADEFALMAEGAGWRVFYVGADPTGATTPLWPIRAMVAQLLELDPMQCSTQDLGRAANLSGVAFEELPGLAELFHLPGPAQDMELNVRRRECYASATQALLCGARGQPVLLVFDDIEGYDAPSREILRRLLQSDATQPIIVLAATAETDTEWLGDAVTRLPPLGGREVLEVCRRAILGINPESSLPRRLAGHTPLPPLRIESLLRLAAQGHDIDHTLSDRQLIVERLQGFGEPALRVLEAAAVLGERFAEADLVRLLEDTSLELPNLDEIFTSLHVHGVLLVTRRGERAFAHRLLHALVYEATPPPRRRTLHWRAANSSQHAATSAFVRAHHMQAAGRSEGIEALEHAAALAERYFDDHAASAYLEAALELAATTEDGAERRNLEVRLVQRLAKVMRARQDARRALRYLEQHRAGATQPLDQARIAHALGVHLARLGQYEEACEALRHALAPAIALGAQPLILEIYAELGQVYARRGDWQRGILELREGLDVCTLGEGPRAEVDFDLWRYLLRTSDVLRGNGALTEARRFSEHALFQAERRNDSLGILRCQAQLAWILRDLRQLTLGERHLGPALELARYFGDRLTTAELLIERARSRAARGRLADARRCCTEALRLAKVIQWPAGERHAERALALITEREAETAG